MHGGMVALFTCRRRCRRLPLIAWPRWLMPGMLASPADGLCLGLDGACPTPAGAAHQQWQQQQRGSRGPSPGARRRQQQSSGGGSCHSLAAQLAHALGRPAGRPAALQLRRLAGPHQCCDLLRHAAGAARAAAGAGRSAGVGGTSSHGSSHAQPAALQCWGCCVAGRAAVGGLGGAGSSGCSWFAGGKSMQGCWAQGAGVAMVHAIQQLAHLAVRRAQPAAVCPMFCRLTASSPSCRAGRCGSTRAACCT